MDTGVELGIAISSAVSRLILFRREVDGRWVLYACGAEAAVVVLESVGQTLSTLIRQLTAASLSR